MKVGLKSIFPRSLEKNGIFDWRLEEKRAFFVGFGDVQGVVLHPFGTEKGNG